MAFFLLLWLLGATDEDQRRGLADYFTPTLIEYKQNSAGSNGILGGDSIVVGGQLPAPRRPDRLARASPFRATRPAASARARRRAIRSTARNSGGCAPS